MPERIHVVLGTNETHSFRYRDFDAYVRRVRSEFLDLMDSDGEVFEPSNPSLPSSTFPLFAGSGL